MKRRIAASLLLFALFAALFGCTRGRDFERDENVPLPTAQETTAPAEIPAGDDVFSFAAGIRMGMSPSEVQSLIGQSVSLSDAEDGRKLFSCVFSGVFVNYATNKSVFFMFDEAGEQLEQLQFQCSASADGAYPADAVALFDVRYGPHAEYESNYQNCLWKAADVYVVLSIVDENNYAVTYSEKDYFEANYPEETEAYRRAAAA